MKSTKNFEKIEFENMRAGFHLTSENYPRNNAFLGIKKIKKIFPFKYLLYLNVVESSDTRLKIEMIPHFLC